MMMTYAERSGRRIAPIGRDDDFDNTALIWEILELRQEKAELLGYDNFADLTLERRMARNGEAALKFTEDLHDRIADAFLKRYRGAAVMES